MELGESTINRSPGAIRRGCFFFHIPAGFALVEVMVVLVVLAVIGTLLLPAIHRSSRQEKLDACAAHLKELHRAQAAYLAANPAQAAHPLGKAFWKALSEPPRPAVDPAALRLLLSCPVFATPGDEGQYLGPSFPIPSRSDADPIGCDELHNHSENGKEGGNVLLKSGEVRTDNRGLWQGAVHEGKCRP